MATSLPFDTSDTNAYRRRLALAMATEGTSTAPVGHWTQGLARMTQALVAAQLQNRIAADEKESDAKNSVWLDKLLPGGGASPAAPVSGHSSPMVGALSQPLPPLPTREYAESEFNPIDAQVATDAELAAGVPAPAKYAALVGKASVDNDVPPQILSALLKQESGFNPNVVSSAGAQGIAQFMPGTAREMGVQNPFDAAQAIPAGAQYLRQQIDRFGGSIPHGLAAYNGGPGRLAQRGNDISRMPDETRNYVANITRMADDPAALPPAAQPTQGYAIPGQQSAPQSRAPDIAPQDAERLQAARQIMLSRNAPPELKRIAAGTIEQLTKPRDRITQETDAQGNIWNVNSLTGEKSVALKRDRPEAPTVREIENPDGTKTSLQYNPKTRGWDPVVSSAAPAAPAAPTNPYTMPGKSTEGEKKIAGYVDRAVKAHNIINGLGDVATSRTQSLLGLVPGAGNALVSEDKQKLTQAQEDFVTAVLRPESGAVINPDEFVREAKKYFPQPGDGPKVIQQKKDARETKIKGMMGEAGKHYKPPAEFKPNAKGNTTSSGVRWSIE
jgi:soluble lytic murein transglycosylase-like protein